jgi:hypothetical protein
MIRRPEANLLRRLSGRTMNTYVEKAIQALLLLGNSEPYAFMGFMETPDLSAFRASDIAHLLTEARLDELDQGGEPSRSELAQWVDYVEEHVWEAEPLKRLWRWAFFVQISDEEGNTWVAVTLSDKSTYHPQDSVFGLYRSHEEALENLRRRGKTAC